MTQINISEKINIKVKSRINNDIISMLLNIPNKSTTNKNSFIYSLQKNYKTISYMHTYIHSLSTNLIALYINKLNESKVVHYNTYSNPILYNYKLYNIIYKNVVKYYFININNIFVKNKIFNIKKFNGVHSYKIIIYM